MQIKKLNYYIPRKEDIIETTSGIRPYREGGIRLEKQVLADKVIFHNYGHGGGGLSLAYGCAEQLINTQFIPLHLTKEAQICILGAGIIGLSTALLLVEKGYKIKIYADQFPFQKHPHKSEMTTTVAAGYWMPIKIGNLEATTKYAISTWNHYKQIYELQESTHQKLGINQIQCYVIDSDEGYVNIEGVIAAKECLVHFGDHKPLKAKTFMSYVIQAKFYLQYLIKRIQESKNVTFIHKILNTHQDFIELKEGYVFNCLGFGSYRIFNDEFKMRAIKGHIIRLKFQPSVADYLLFMKVSTDNYILQIPHRQSQRLNLGITFEPDCLNPFPEQKMIDKIFNNSKNYFQTVERNCQKPKL